MSTQSTPRFGPNILREAQAQITEDAHATVDQLRSLLAMLRATEVHATGPRAVPAERR